MTVKNKNQEVKDQALNTLLNNIFLENRRSRRWGNFFKIVTFLYLFILLFIFLSKPGDQINTSGDFTALVKLNGIISSESEINAEDAIKSLQKAMKCLLEIDSDSQQLQKTFGVTVEFTVDSNFWLTFHKLGHGWAHDFS